MKTREICFTALAIAMCSIFKLVFNFIPNVQPVTTCLILLAMFVSLRVSLLTGFGTILLTSLLTSIGSWTIFQIIGWAIISLIACKLKNFYPALIWSIVGAFVYGFVNTVSMVPYVGWIGLPVAWVGGLSFDLLHAVGNAVFMVLLFKLAQNTQPKMQKWLSTGQAIRHS
ncbi:MAG: hypothetical protein RSB96_03690 [Oscillospiraceae bacterium]